MKKLKHNRLGVDIEVTERRKKSESSRSLMNFFAVSIQSSSSICMYTMAAYFFLRLTTEMQTVISFETNRSPSHRVSVEPETRASAG